MKEVVIEILKDLRPELDFTQEGVNFIEQGYLDSFDIVSLVDDIEDKLGVEIEGSDVISENFSNLDAICKTIEKNKN